MKRDLPLPPAGRGPLRRTGSDRGVAHADPHDLGIEPGLACNHLTGADLACQRAGVFSRCAPAMNNLLHAISRRVQRACHDAAQVPRPDHRDRWLAWHEVAEAYQLPIRTRHQITSQQSPITNRTRPRPRSVTRQLVDEHRGTETQRFLLSPVLCVLCVSVFVVKAQPHAKSQITSHKS